jgi:UDP:flavonoid glycosyltransferase YjiC (YdhE family)
VPLARAFVDDGHEVAFATSGSFREPVEEAGFELLPAGIDQVELEARHAPYRARLGTMPVSERRPFAFTWRFATIEAPAKIEDLRGACSAWHPDLLVHESADLAAPLVAASIGVPRVNHSFGRLVPVACYERASAEIERLWSRLGVDPEPLCGAFGGTYVDICPPSFQTHAMPPGLTVEKLRPLFPASAGAPPPPWIAALPERPTVYITLGTVRNELSLFRALLDGLAGLDANVVATIGRGNDPTELAPLPPNAHVERYVPQSFVLPHAAVVIAHGGSGSILGTFAEGLPTLLVPQGADQFDNAGRCSELGAGLVLMPGEVTSAAVRDAVETLLADPSYRHRARELAAEIAAMPSPAEVARRLEATVV